MRILILIGSLAGLSTAVPFPPSLTERAALGHLSALTIQIPERFGGNSLSPSSRLKDPSAGSISTSSFEPSASTNSSVISDTLSKIGNVGLPAFSNTKVTKTNASRGTTADRAITKLLSKLDQNTDMFNGIGYWQSGNAYTAIIRNDLLKASSTSHRNSIGTALTNVIPKGDPNWPRSKTSGLDNEYNDDGLWWALACIDAYQAYGGNQYIAEAERLWDWVKSTSMITQTGIEPNMGGIQRTVVVSDQCSLENGVYWTIRKDETYVNSITTGLFFQTSARLFELTGDTKYEDTAITAHDWLQSHTVDGQTLVKEDGVKSNTCATQGGAWTYNTGVYIGALASLYTATGNSDYLMEAEVAAASAMETTVWTDGNGMITESKGATTNNDGVGFRSILIRNLVALYLTSGVSQATKQEIKGFVNTNYNSLYNKARNGNAYDVNWFGPFTQETTHGQFVAVDLLVAGSVVNK